MESRKLFDITRVLERKKRYMDLLLLADPSEEIVEKYLEEGELFVLSEKGMPICAAVVVQISDDTCELKNIATDPQYQGKGYGKQMVKYLLDFYRRHYTQMIVGTGNSSLNNIEFYQKCGFEYSHTIRNFFIDNYPEPIFENGIQCVDMICLKIKL